MEDKIHHHKSWEDATDVQYNYIRDGLENLILPRILEATLGELKQQFINEDKNLSLRLTTLASFITAEHLNISKSFINETVIDLAATTLKELDTKSTPAQKMTCISECCKLVFSTLKLQRGKSYHTRNNHSDTTVQHGLPGADDFMPVFIYVLIRAKVL